MTMIAWIWIAIGVTFVVAVIALLENVCRSSDSAKNLKLAKEAVSYTHLTLPTILLV